MTAVGRHSPDGPVVPFGQACVFLAIPFPRDPIELHVFDPEAFQKLKDLVIRNASRRLVRPVERVHILIKSSRGGRRRRIDPQGDEPEGLQGFPESPPRDAQLLNAYRELIPAKRGQQ